MADARNARNGRGFSSVLVAGLFAALIGAAAQAQPSFSFFATNVDSNGRVPGHPSGGDFCNGVVGPNTYSGSAFAVGKLRLTGTAQSTDPMWWNTYVDELTYSVIIYDSSNVKKAQWNASSVKPIHSQFWYHNPVAVDNTQSAAALGTIQPGDKIEIRFWETLDDPVGGNPCNLVDATWTSTTVQFIPAVPGGGGGGILVERFNSDEPLSIDTDGSDYDTVIAIFSDDGNVIATDDDGGGVPGGPSAITLYGLGPGEYHLAVIGQGGGFDDGFLATPGDAGGNLVVNYNGGGSVEARTHADSVVWYSFSLRQAPCVADLDGDGQIGQGDLGVLLSLWGTFCP